MSLTVALWMASLAQFDTFAPMPAYRPAFFPSALAGAHSEGALVGDACLRGHRPIQSRWTLKRAFGDLVPVLRREIQFEDAVKDYSDELLDRRGVLTAYRPLADRMIQILIQKGRFVVTKGPNFRNEELRDEGTYVTATLTERPLLAGPLPGSWLAAARKAPALPAHFAGLPVLGLVRTPDAWHRGPTPGGALQYWISWFVPEPPSKTIRRMLERLERSKEWRATSRPTEVSVRCEPVKPGTGFVWLSLTGGSDEMPDLPNSFTRVTVSWTDPGRSVSR